MHSKDNILSKYKIKKISEVDINKLSYFYKKIYFERHKSLTNNWRWWYRVGLTEAEPIILSLNDKIIGQAAYLPTELNVLGKKIRPPYRPPTFFYEEKKSCRNMAIHVETTKKMGGKPTTKTKKNVFLGLSSVLSR